MTHPPAPRWRHLTVAASMIAVLALSAVPASAGGIPKGKVAIGDSVMLGARQRLRSRGIRVDATVSRQFGALPSVIKQMRRAGRLPKTVIVHLGNNGYVEPAACRRAVRLAANRQIYLVTLKVPRRWRRANNKRLARCAGTYARVHLIDWYSRSKSHGDWFARDGYHLTARGARRYAGILSNQTR
jgi:hypothetical protein